MSNETFATGDAVNVAARLEQGAGPGQVLLGELTYRLVREAVRAEAVEPLDAKGKSEPVPAYRLLDADLFPTLRRAGTPFAGREDELRLLERELEAVVSRQRCRLVTVVGEPGVGKSRLTAEFVSRVGPRARVVRGACLSYGEGTTFWAIGEIVRDLAGIQNDHSPARAQALIEAQLEGVPNGAVVAANLAQLLGITDGFATAAETAWATRQFLVAQAHLEPLFLLVDDLHWAEDALLDLVAGLPAAILDAPILVLCLSRPELLQRRPDWEVTSRLEPLGAEEVDALLRSLLGEMPAAVQRRLALASAGNPLFAEELAAMLLDEGVVRTEGGVCHVQGDLDDLALPAGLHALLGARLDRLDAHARATLERGAIQGDVFHGGALLELSAPETRPSVPTVLDDLVETDLVRAAEASFVGDSAFRFKHVLVRDSAYQATAKKLRAVLHEQFADWLERAVGDRVAEYEEILGYHLEQSHRFRAELGPVDPATRALGERAAGRLAAAGLRAHGRGDFGAAANLLGRAAALLPFESRERIELVLALVAPLTALMRVAEVETLLEQAGTTAELLGDERLSARVAVENVWVVVQSTAAQWSESRVLSELEEAIAVFERLGDDVALARALEVVGNLHLYYGRLSKVAAASERGYRHAERAGQVKEQGMLRLVREVADQWGPMPFDQIDERLEDDLAWARRTGSVLVEAEATLRLGVVRAIRGDRARGNELAARGKSFCEELGTRIWAHEELACWTWALTDDPELAEAWLRETYGVVAEAGKRGMLATIASFLAECLYRQSRYGEADEMLTEAAELGADDDVYTRARVHAGNAKLSARRGDLARAESVAREGVAVAGGAEFFDLRGDTLLALAEVLRLAGQKGEAAGAVRQALALWQAKGAVVYANQARALVAEL
jgi:tetratricopeptide (TPR) repeat protein